IHRGDRQQQNSTHFAGRIIATVTTGVGEPTSVSVDGDGKLFVVSADSDFWEAWQAVRKVSPGGKITLVAGGTCEPHTAYCPPSLSDGTSAVTIYLGDRLSTAVDADRNLVAASPVNRRIYRVFPDGSIVSAAGNGEYDFSGDGSPATSARLPDPMGVAVDRDGSVLFADYFNA